MARDPDLDRHMLELLDAPRRIQGETGLAQIPLRDLGTLVGRKDRRNCDLERLSATPCNPPRYPV